MGVIAKQILIGVLVSIIATCFGLFLYIEYFSPVDFAKSVQMIEDGKLYGKILSIAAIPNLFVFFVFIRRKEDYKARGVLLFTILIAITTFILKFVL
ncbi:MAG: hypothetical protein CMB99_05915 [Flavobacteriaceae bacterium]|nr:hypothetical protein [Flavobacteriaceae bacterium]